MAQSFFATVVLIQFQEKYYSACLPAEERMPMPTGGGFTKKYGMKTFSYYIFQEFYAKFNKSDSPLGDHAGQGEELAV
ncbi:MAG TPA: hypothetical protein ENI89_08835 [Desulfobulbus sp.]|nr:hypothetical protein [Desulfobulbus sp.]